MSAMPPKAPNERGDVNASVMLAGAVASRKYEISVCWDSEEPLNKDKGASGEIYPVTVNILNPDTDVTTSVACIAKKLISVGDSSLLSNELLREEGELQRFVADGGPTNSTGVLTCYTDLEKGYVVMPRCRMDLEECARWLKYLPGTNPELFTQTTIDAIHLNAAESLVRALKTLKERNVLHCDIKPLNIGLRILFGGLRRKGFVFGLFDFGLAVDLTKQKNDEGNGVKEIKGTLLYCAPEVLCREDPTEDPTENPTMASDIYSAGATLLELLVGRESLRYYQALSEGGSSPYVYALGTEFNNQKEQQKKNNQNTSFTFDAAEFIDELKKIQAAKDKMIFIAQKMYSILPEARPDLETLETAFSLVSKQLQQAMSEADEKNLLSAYQVMSNITVVNPPAPCLGRRVESTLPTSRSFLSGRSTPANQAGPLSPVPVVSAGQSGQVSPQKDQSYDDLSGMQGLRPLQVMLPTQVSSGPAVVATTSPSTTRITSQNNSNCSAFYSMVVNTGTQDTNTGRGDNPTVAGSPIAPESPPPGRCGSVS